MILKNVASQIVQLGSLIKTSDGSRLTTSATVRWCKDGTWADGAGTLTVEETDQYKYAPTQAETNVDEWAVSVDHASAVAPLVLWGHTNYPQTGDAYALANNATYGLAAAATDRDLRSPAKTWYVAGEAEGILVLTSPSESFILGVNPNGNSQGTEGNSAKTLTVIDGASEGTSYNSSTNVITVTVDISGGHNTVYHLLNAINAGTDFYAIPSGWRLPSWLTGTITTSTTGTTTMTGYDSTASDGNAGTRSAPLASYAGAITNCKFGDTIKLLKGSHQPGFHTTSGIKVYCEFGAYLFGSSTTSNAALLVSGNRNYFSINAWDTKTGTGVRFPNTYGNEFENCNCFGPFDGGFGKTCLATKVTRSFFGSGFDVFQWSGSRDFDIDSCLLASDGTYSATPNSDSRVLIADTNVTTNCTGRVRNTTMYCQRFVADSGTAIGIEAGGLTGLDPSNIQIENVTVIAQLLQSGASGAAYCIKRSKLNSDDVLAATIKGGALYASKVSGGTIAHIDANSTGSVVLADGLSYDRTQCTNSAANITDTPLNASTAATQSTAAAADLPVKLKKNVSFPGFKFKLEKSNGDPATGKTVTAQRLIDSGSFANCTNAVSEKSGGWYIIDLSAADLNGDCIALKFTASGANQRDMMIVTQ